MKVLLINIGHSRDGGAFTVYLNTAEMLRASGIQVVQFALHSANELPCEQADYFAKEVTQSHPIDYVLKRFYNTDAAHCLQHLIDDVHPDVAHVHLMWGGLAPSILNILRRNCIPVVHTVHDYAMICSMVTLRGRDGTICERCKGGRFWESVKTRCHGGSLFRSLIAASEITCRNKRFHPVDLVSHFLFVSNFCLEKHCEMDNRFQKANKSVLYNIPDSRIVKIAEEPLPDTFDSYYLYYGRLSYEKGLETLIKSFTNRPNQLLKVVGTGPLEEKLKSFCKKIGAKNIEFVGFKTGNDLFRIVQKAKFVCVPSEWYENNPMTIVESYTLGTPVIAARIGGIPEIVEEYRTGFLFESGSQESLEIVMQESESLDKESYLQMKKAARSFANATFQKDLYVERLMSLYQEILNNE